MSAAYYVRPNTATLKLLQKYRTLPIKMRRKVQQSLNITNELSVPDLNNGMCITVYIRRADKGTEMKLQPFSAYTKAIEIIMEKYLNHTVKSHHLIPSKGKPAIFVGAETNAVLKEMEEWGKEHNHQVGEVNVTRE